MNDNIFAPTIAVTGLNATDNPGPGLTVIRALRLHPAFRGRIVGLAYDAWEPGVFASELVDDVYLVPYPSQGVGALRDRLHAIHAQTPLDMILPNFDSEIASYLALEDELRAMGIATFLPTRTQLDLRAKANLARLGDLADIPVPAQKVILSADDLYNLPKDITYPLILKGPFYGAQLVGSIHEAIGAFHRYSISWGLPVIAQQYIPGEEFDVVAVGDGEGGLVGAVPMKKTYRTDKGKGWCGITVKDADSLAITEAFMRHTHWRGPCEIEILRGADGRSHLLEINPRFPAWAFLSAGAGQNLPYAVVELAMGRPVAPMREYTVGKIFARVSLELLGDISQLQGMITTGELHYRLPQSPPETVPPPLQDKSKKRASQLLAPVESTPDASAPESSPAVEKTTQHQPAPSAGAAPIHPHLNEEA